MKSRIVLLLCFVLTLFATSLRAPTAEAGQTAPRCAYAWSHYSGWEPWGWIGDNIAQKWGTKYGVRFSVALINDYIESVNQYTAGAFDGVAVTNMDGLTIPGVGGVDTTVLIVGSFSNGNDGILVNGPPGQLAQYYRGKTFRFVQGSVSHFLFANWLDSMKLSERDVKVVNTSDADIGSLIATSKLGDAFVTWNPILMTGRNVRGVTMIYDSSKIPGQIIDTLMVRTSVSDNCKKAVTGAWYEAMALMSSSGPGNVAMVRDLAAQAGGTEAEFKAQLTTTRMFFNPAEAAAFASGPQVKQTMEAVARFSFAHGLYERAPNAEYVGIQYPDGVVFGNRVNTKLRFDARYMQMAALGQL